MIRKLASSPWFARFFLVTFAVGAILQRESPHLYAMLPKLSASLATIGLLTLVLVARDVAISNILNKYSLHGNFHVGVLFGATVGAIGGVPYAMSVSVGPVEAYMRVFAFSVMIGLCLHFILISALRINYRLSTATLENYIVLILLSMLLAVITFVIASNVNKFGHNFEYISIYAIDWIGSGACPTIHVRVDDCKYSLDNIDPWNVALLLGILAALEIIYFRFRSGMNSLGIARSIMYVSLAGLSASFIVPYIVGGEEMRASDYPRLIAFAAIWGLLVGGAFAWILKRTRLQGTAEALAAAFAYDRAAFDEMLQSRLDTRLNPKQRDFKQAVGSLVLRSELEGWLEELIVVARYSRPEDDGLARVAEAVGLDAIGPSEDDIKRIADRFEIDPNLPPQMRLDSLAQELGFATSSEWLSMIAVQEPRICRIEAPAGNIHGTGFLIGPDLVLTNGHVYDRAKANLDSKGLDLNGVAFRFDFRQLPKGRVVSDGTVYRLSSSSPLLDVSKASDADLDPSRGDPAPEELDYALLRLAEPAGTLAIGQNGKAEEGAPVRGWIKFSNPPVKANNNDILILQHPGGASARQANGRLLGFNENETRVRHDADTLPGSSGSPCIDIRTCELVALHQARAATVAVRELHSDRPVKNAIPIHSLIALMKKRPHLNGIWSQL